MATATVVSLVVLVSACGDDSGAGGNAETETIRIAVEDGAATPAGERIEVGVNQPVDLVVTADTAGELHVHSSPEQYVEFEAGENDPIMLQFERPGLVEIELHEPAEGPVVELQVE